MTRWEYMVRTHLGETDLNALGAEGWELTGVVHDSERDRRVCYLKRPSGGA